jgi:phosphohistidine phosphatase SixA
VALLGSAGTRKQPHVREGSRLWGTMQEKSRQIELRRHAAVVKDLQDLSAEGEQQVHRWARGLADVPPIFCSPTRRTRATASRLFSEAIVRSLSTAEGRSDEGTDSRETRGQAASPSDQAPVDAVEAFWAEAIVAELAFEDEERWHAAAKAAGSSKIDALRRRDRNLVEAEGSRVADTIQGIFDRIPDGSRAFVVGHSPLIEAAVYHLFGRVIKPLAESEGVKLTRDDQGRIDIQEVRLPFRGTKIGQALLTVLLLPLAAAIALPLYELLQVAFSTELLVLEIGVVFIGLALTMSILAFSIGTERRREALLHRESWPTVIGAMLAIFLLAILSFGSLTAFLYQRGVVSIEGPGVSNESIAGKGQDFFAWQLLDAIPVLEVTGTLRLEPPFNYHDHWVGALVVIFKALVILPIIRTAIFVYNRLTQPRPLIS